MFQPFQAFGISHWATLVLTAACLALMLHGGRRQHPWSRPAELALGWAVFSSHFINIAGLWWTGMTLNWQNLLPMHLCNWAGFAVWAGLVFRHRLAIELGWLWAMVGTIQGLVTPNQDFDWPNPTFLGFFLLHSGTIIGAAHGVFGMNLPPRPGLFRRGLLWSEGYVLAAATVNLLTGANFAFMRDKPVNPSLLDHLGPWPWYLLSVQIIGISILFLAALPFRVRKPKNIAP